MFDYQKILLGKFKNKNRLLEKQNQKLGQQNLNLQSENNLLKQEVIKLQTEAKLWKEAWWKQRDATGQNYWIGFNNGSKSVQGRVE